MPWKATCPMEERENFIRDWLVGEENFSALCRRYGIHRSVGYKWRNRYLREGIAGLAERSRAPHRHPNKTPEDIAAALMELRSSRPRWGADKLVHILSRRHPEIKWPCPSTAHEILRRAGLIERRKRRQRSGHYTSSLAGYYGPNAVWAVDFKGHFGLHNGQRCHPLTISDLCTRYLLRCDALRSEKTTETKRMFHRTFCQYGLPDVIRSDNGGPFSSVSGLSELSVWWIKLGIRPERITPGCPTENGIHERIHKTMDDELATLPQRSFNRQQQRFLDFKRDYNTLRPHEALAMQTPEEVYHPSTRHFPTTLKSPEYSDEFRVQRVNKDGRIAFKGSEIYVSRLIATEPVGLRETERGMELWYGPQILGTINQKGELRRGLPKPRTRRRGVLEKLEKS